MVSLTKRLTFLVIALLCVCWVIAGVTFYWSLQRAIKLELERRLSVRLAWLGASLAIDLPNGGSIKLHKRRDPDGAAEAWRVATHDGKTLWSSPWPAGSRLKPTVEQSSVLGFGASDLPIAASADIVSREELTWKGVPARAREVAERAVSGLVADRVEGTVAAKNGGLVFRVEGRGELREVVIAVAESGKVIKIEQGKEIDPQATTVMPRYRLTGRPARIELVLTVGTSAAAMEEDLAWISWGLKTIGPLSLFLTGALMALSIRWQLQPLARMAEQAQRIGPASLTERIGPVGSNFECAQLREAINSMLDRLAEGLEREHRFAATAAHELRTPIAQLRTTIEVALRRERTAEEYRTALEETLADTERLQKLVIGLLHLTRSTERAATTGRPVHLALLLRKTAKDHGLLALVGGPACPDLAVEGDEDLFASALGNVLDNAARYAPDTPPTLRCEESSDRVQIIVSDQGPGVPDGERERIFQPLRRLDPRVSDDGLGLGLTIARASVRAYGGDLTCQARKDRARGAEFVFSFLKAHRQR